MAELGQIAVHLLLVLAAWAAALAVVGVRRGSARLLRGAEILTYATAAASTLATVTLLHAFAVSDFSLVYVHSHSDRAMPLFYRLSGAWGGQEGSLLVWAWMLTCFSALAVRGGRARIPRLLPHAIALLMGVTVFFGVLLVTTSNPFSTFLAGIPEAGRGLNPLLQHPLMVAHPPALYLGYTGMAIPFAFAMASLLRGERGDAWAAAARPWVIFSWYFLGLGLVLGMLWAYEELGWGGYWAWDPVENAGLFPWLTATALLHTLAVQERRGLLRGWSALLALLSFVLTIFGTFLTRSGFIASVHAFSRSNIGYVFLAFIGLICTFGAAVLIERRACLRGRTDLGDPSGRETWFVLSSWVQLFATVLIVVLTLFPTFSDWLGAKRTITPAAFNRWMTPLGLALLGMTALCPLLEWRRTSQQTLLRRLRAPLGAALVVVAATAALGLRQPLPLVAWGLCAAIVVGAVQETISRAAARARGAGSSLGAALGALLLRNPRRYGGHLVHLGVAMMFVGFAGEAFKTERQLALQRGGLARVGRYTLRFDGIGQREDAQKQMTTAALTVFVDGENVGRIEPAQWIFFRRPEMPTSEVGLRRTLREDLFVALGSADLLGQAATFKVIVNPLVNWIWIGFLLLTLGTGVAELPQLLRREGRRPAAPTASAEEAGR